MTSSNPLLTLTTHLGDAILRVVLSVMLFILAAIQTVKQSIDMFKATKQWKPNKYMQQLMADGILYFLVYDFPFYFHSLLLYSATHLSVKHPHINSLR